MNKINRCVDCGKLLCKRAFYYKVKRCRSCSCKQRYKNPKNHPAYKDGNAIKKYHCINCKIEISINAKRCNSCAKKKLFNNPKNHPFYGKHHSLKTKRKISSMQKGKQNGKQKGKESILKGKKLSLEHRKKISLGTKKAMKNPEIRKKISKSHIKYMLTHKGIFIDTDIELKFKKELQKRDIKFIHPYRIPKYRHLADFYIPKISLIINTDGEYWHNLPGRKQIDKKHNTFMRNNGYFVKRLKGKSIMKERIDYDKMFKRYKKLNIKKKLDKLKNI